jgi:hypothetical protein
MTNSIDYEKIFFLLKDLISEIEVAEGIYKELLLILQECCVYEKLSKEKK